MCRAAIICAVVLIVVVVVITVPLVLLLPRTGEFRATFMKKCEGFPESSQTCEKLLSTFERAYVGEEPCSVPETNYDPLIDLSPFTHPAHGTMFWSKISDLPHEYTKKISCLVNLEDTLLGSVLDEESWCGKKGSNETFTKLCEKCEKSPVKSFWNKIATRFAQYAEGVVTAMLNGDVSEPYDPKSVFASKEVPNLRPGVVTRLDVVLVTNTGDCNHPSLQTLKNDLNNRGIGYTCKAVTRSVQYSSSVLYRVFPKTVTCMYSRPTVFCVIAGLASQSA